MKIRQEIYDTYWYCAAERQKIFFKRLKNDSSVLSLDPIFQKYKFCNSYRASDRVSQFLIKNVIYKYSDLNELDILFRIIFFRLFNKIQTWEILEEKVGRIELKNFSFEKYSDLLEEIKEKEGKIYGNAFILCANDAFKQGKKHKNHLALLETIFKTTKKLELLNSKSLKELFENLKTLPLIGNFMAYQIAIDLNYSEIFDFDENDFTCVGPGAERGIRKCFTDLEGKSKEDVIMYMVENQDKEFERLGLNFKNLFGRKLHAIDCQGLFCETDKYCRVKFPELKSNRVRMKSEFKPTKKSIKLFYPPKWKINEKTHLSQAN